MAPKSFKEYTANHFWQTFSFIIHSTKGWTFTTNGRPFFPVDWDELCLLCKGGPFLTQKCFYLEWSDIGCKKLFFNGRLFCPNQLIWTALPLQGWLISLRKVCLLRTIWYRLQKVPKRSRQTIFEKFSMLWLILL